MIGKRLGFNFKKLGERLGFGFQNPEDPFIVLFSIAAIIAIILYS